MHNKSLSGYLDASIYIMLSAVSFVFLDHLLSKLNPLIPLFAMSASALIIFNGLSWRQRKVTYRTCRDYPKLYLIMSASLAIDWACMVFASQLADPFVAMAALFSSLAIIGFGKLFLQRKNSAFILSIVFLLSGLIILAVKYQVKPTHQLGLGILLGCLAGLAFYTYMLSSNHLSLRGNLTALQVLSTRFWVLFIGAATLVPKPGLLDLLLANAVPLLLISLTSLVIPIYFNQQAIQKLGAELTSVFISLVPPLTYLFYAIYNHQFIWVNFITCGVITIALLLPQLIKYFSTSAP